MMVATMRWIISGFLLMAGCGNPVTGPEEFRVVSFTPAHRTINVPVNTAVTFTFNAPIDTTARVDPMGGSFLGARIGPFTGVIPGNLQISPDQKTVRIPLVLSNNIRYVVTLFDAQSRNGKHLLEPVTTAFTTGQGEQQVVFVNSNFRAIAITPALGATRVPTTTSIVVTFNAPLDTTANLAGSEDGHAAAFFASTLSPLGFNTVQGRRVSDDLTTLTIDLALLDDQFYVFTLFDAQSAAGALLAEPVTTTFTTETLPSVTAQGMSSSEALGRLPLFSGPVSSEPLWIPLR